MNDFMFDLGVSVVITMLRGMKGEAKKKKMRAVFLKIHKLIQGVYGDDEEFQS